MKNDVSVIILAAGKSSRMGRPKMMLEFSNGMSFLEEILFQYSRFGCQEIIVVVNEESKNLLKNQELCKKYPFKIILNKYPEKERSYSIYCGLLGVQEADFVFIHNVDNPFADRETLQKLYEQRETADYIKAVFQSRGGHPILISNKVIQEIVELKGLEKPLNLILKTFSCEKVIVENEHILTNINNESDYFRLIKPNKE